MGEQVVVGEKNYRLSRAGRRMAYLLLTGGVLVWLFALWTLKNTLQIGVRNFVPSVQNLFNRLSGAAAPLGAEEAIPAVIMLVLVVVVPLLLWNLIEELRASYTVGPSGVTFRSGSIVLSYPWSEVASLRPVDAEEEEPLDELVVRTSRLGSIRNPLVRFLHWQAYGRHKLPLYSGLEDRDDLVARIRAFMVGDLGALGVAVAGGEAATTEAAVPVLPPETGTALPEAPAGEPAQAEAETADLPWAGARSLIENPPADDAAEPPTT